MNIGAVNRTLGLAKAILASSDQRAVFAKLAASKPSLPISPAAFPLERATPESEGVDSGFIARFLDELYNDLSLNMHNVMILRHGKIIAEASFGRQNMQCPKMTFSACKSIVSLAIGLLADEGRLTLQDKISAYFADEISPINRIKLRELTVEQLLTMSSGVVFNEAEAVTESDWLKAFFSSATKFGVGKEFSYNSLNTYVLSALVTRITGLSLTDYLTPRLFKPLGITDIYWAKCPQGIDIGGWGLYIRPEDMAKIGILVMRGGVWRGRRLISENYIREATRAHIEAPRSAGAFDYGYQIWVGRDGNSFLFNGMLGQNLLAFPKNDIILVTNAGNDETFQQDDYFDIALEYFGKALPQQKLPRSAKAERTLKKTLGKLRLSHGESVAAELPMPFRFIEARRKKACDDVLWRRICGKGFRPIGGRACMQLLPIALQVVEGSYTSNLSMLKFDAQGGDRLLIYCSEKDEFELRIGRTSEIKVGKSVYSVAAALSFGENATGAIVARITVDFLETPFTRIITVLANGKRSVIRHDELPTKTLLRNGIDDIFESLDERSLVAGFAERLDKDYLDWRIDRALSPEVVAEECAIEARLSEKNAD